jgi:plasmid stabilization system protein ParE
VQYYADRAGTHLAHRFVAEIEAIYHGLVERRLVGVNHSRIRFRVPLRRVFLDRFPFAVVFYVEDEMVHVVALEALRSQPGYWRGRLRGR